MKKINDLIMKICLGVIMPVGLFGVIYEYLIWDKSIVPEWLYWSFWISGWIALIGLIITLVIDKKQK